MTDPTQTRVPTHRPQKRQAPLMAFLGADASTFGTPAAHIRARSCNDAEQMAATTPNASTRRQG